MGEKINNPNHPAQGSKITVSPIRNLKHIKSISKSLESSPRDLLLFVMGINNGLRCGDLLQLKVHQVKNLKVGEHITIVESKTSKDNILMMNKSIHSAMGNYLHTLKPDNNDFLFRSRKGKNRPLTIQSVNRLVKLWTRKYKGNYGAHSLRKTWGYHQRTTFGVSFEVLCKRFNHSNPAVTMRYLGLQSKEVENILLNEIG